MYAWRVVCRSFAAMLPALTNACAHVCPQQGNWVNIFNTIRNIEGMIQVRVAGGRVAGWGLT